MTHVIERQEINDHTKSHRNGNSNSFVSYIVPTRWKAICMISDMNKEQAIGVFEKLVSGNKDSKFRLSNWDNGEIVTTN